MRRREFVALLGGAGAWPVVAQGQTNRLTIGYFSTRSSNSEGQYKASFLRGLGEAGYADRQNVFVEYRFADGQDAKLPAIAADLVRQNVGLLVATDGPSALAARAVTTTIPIVFSAGSDPVTLGLAESTVRPGRNATGIYIFVAELGPKRLQLLREIVPEAKTIAFIVNPSSGSGPQQIRAMRVAAQAMGQHILVLNASTTNEINAAFAAITESKAAAIVYSANPFFQVIHERLVALAAKHATPAIYEWPEFVRAGGLISYSSNRSEAGHQMGKYAGQILDGAKPGDLPLVQSSKFELVINLKTAKTLGLTIPIPLLGRADEVIE